MSPEDFGLKSSPLEELVVADSNESLQLIQKVFAGEHCAARDAVALNAGAGIYVSGLANSLAVGVEKALAVIDAGQAHEKLSAYVAATQAVATQNK